jgi:hypothetical protein
VIAEHEARGEHFKWADRTWRWGRRRRNDDNNGARKTDEEEEIAYRVPAGREDGDADKDLTSEPDSPVAVGFPPGTAVERTIDGEMKGVI